MTSDTTGTDTDYTETGHIEAGLAEAPVHTGVDAESHESSGTEITPEAGFVATPPFYRARARRYPPRATSGATPHPSIGCSVSRMRPRQAGGHSGVGSGDGLGVSVGSGVSLGSGVNEGVGVMVGVFVGVGVGGCGEHCAGVFGSIGAFSVPVIDSS